MMQIYVLSGLTPFRVGATGVETHVVVVHMFNLYGFIYY